VASIDVPKKPGRYEWIAAVLTAACASTFGVNFEKSSRCPLLAHPVAASGTDPAQRWMMMSGVFPVASNDTRTSPSVRHGMSACPLFQIRVSWLSSNVANVVPCTSSRVKPRYRNPFAPCGSYVDHASRRLFLPGDTPPASVVRSQSPGAFSLLPPLNAVSSVLSSDMWLTRVAAWSACQSVRGGASS
jgi:hypothetical protein